MITKTHLILATLCAFCLLNCRIVSAQTYTILPGLENEYNIPNPANARVNGNNQDIFANVIDGQLIVMQDSSGRHFSLLDSQS